MNLSFSAFTTRVEGVIATIVTDISYLSNPDVWQQLEKNLVITPVDFKPKDPKPEGLRARKRRATENAIEMSAVKLALEQGVDRVTVEAVCDQADISRSTFFNYFTARDYAIVGRAISIPEGPEAFAVLDASPDNLPLGIYRLLFAAIGHRSVNTDVARLRMQLFAEQPEAARMSQITILESSRPIFATAMAWLHAHPEHRKLDSLEREAWLAATLVHSIVSAQMMDWVKGVGDMETDETSFHSVVADAQTLLQATEFTR